MTGIYVQRKPIDLGNGDVVASFGHDGSWLSVGWLHPEIGLIELVGVQALSPAAHGSPDAVRAHRESLMALDVSPLSLPGTTGVWDPSTATWTVAGHDWESSVTAEVSGSPARVTQRHTLRPAAPGRLVVSFSGRLDRPEYAMITPVGPPPPRLPGTTTRARGAVLEVAVPGCRPPAVLEIGVTCRSATAGDWLERTACAELQVEWEQTHEPVEVTLTVTPRDGRLGHGTRLEPLTVDDPLDRIAAGARRYTLQCTAWHPDREHCCILTDHRLLPLSWTRDAYYQAALLLCSRDPQDHAVVRHHLAWLWGPGRTADGVWHRSHFVDGAVKDKVYQADQQLYPLLELADFRRVTGELPDPPGPGGWGESVRSVWLALPRTDGLVAGAENPADDPALPFLLSSQLLLAYTARRLAEWEGELGVKDLRLGDDADGVIGMVHKSFRSDGPYGQQWAYDTDGAGLANHYHDANDVPTAIAPLWVGPVPHG